MKIINAPSSLGVRDAVEITRMELIKATNFEAIVSFVKEKGANSIIEKNGEKFIVIKIGPADPNIFPIKGLGPALQKVVSQF